MATAHFTPVLYIFDSAKALRLCKEQDRTHKELAVRTSRGPKSVEDYLKGRTDPTATWVGALAAILSVEPGDLYRPVCEDDLTEAPVDVKPMTRIKVASRRQRLRRTAS